MASFDINRPKVDGKPGAMLPTYGLAALKALPAALQLDSVDAYLHAIHASMADDIAAKVAGINVTMLEAAKALGAVPPQAVSYSTMSFLPDPANYGMMQWPGLNPESLRKICRDNVSPIVIIRQRADDMARYSGFSSHIWKPGWCIKLRDASETPTAQERKDIKEAEKFIYNCSMDGDQDPRKRDARLIAPFDTFLRSFADDALTFDGWAIWTNMDSQGQIQSFANLPAGLIRLAVPTRGIAGDPKMFAAMVDETGNPIKPFTRDELIWRVRNVRLDPSIVGYGWPEAEMAIRLIQAFTGGVELNAQTFTQSAIPNGMLLLKGDYWNQEQIDALQREWTNMKRGMSKLWGLPVMAVPEDGDVTVLPFMDLKGQDVRYRDHLNMMMGLCCLIWRFPIRRLGMFVSGQHRDNAPVQDAAIEIQGADDPGLPPLLMHVEETLNSYILWQRWPHLSFEFMSKNPKEDARRYEALKLARTWGEARAEADLPKLSKMVSKELQPLAEIMEMAPEDPVKSSVFQTVAVTLLEDMLGVNDETDPANPGSPMRSKKDPAASQGHGHLSGTRRNSRAEKDKASVEVKVEA